jgi:hypothetical protein
MHKALWCFILLGACATVEEPVDSDVEDTDDTDAAIAEPCSGEGEPGVRFGGGGRADFIDFGDGDLLVLTEDSAGARGFWLEAMIEGIDMRDAVNVVYRVRIDGGPSEDYITRVGLSCDDLAGWTKGFFPFDEDVDTTTLDGASFEVSGVFATDAGEVAEGVINLIGSPDW